MAKELSEILGEKKSDRQRDERGKFAPEVDKPKDDPKPEPEAPAKEPEKVKDKSPEGDKAPEKEAAATPAAREEETGNVPVAALKDERRKRQEAEGKLTGFEKQIAELSKRIEAMASAPAPAQQPQQQAQPQPMPDMFADPDGWQKHQQNAQRMQVLEMSQFIMRSSKPDYAEAETAFAQAAQQNPALGYAMWQHPIHMGGPAGFAYEQGKRILQMKKFEEIGDIDTHIKTKAEELALSRVEELKTQWQAEQAETLKRNSSIPPSLADARSSAQRNPSKTEFTGPTPLAGRLHLDRKKGT